MRIVFAFVLCVFLFWFVVVVVVVVVVLFFVVSVAFFSAKIQQKKCSTPKMAISVCYNLGKSYPKCESHPCIFSHC